MENVVASVEFWKGKHVFITGHTGFKGAWLSLWLQKMGAIVTGYALDAPTVPNLFSAANVENDMDSVSGDIRYLDNLETALVKSNPDIVIHMAAQSLVQYSYQYPVDTFSTNVMGTVNLLQAVRQSENVRAVVIVTSDKCYANNEWIWGYRENEQLGGNDPYSSSKACTEIITNAFVQSFFSDNDSSHTIACATARAGNVIGGGDWSENRLFPDIFRAIEQKTTLEIRHPEAIRPWQHVMEPLNGYLLLAENLYQHGKSYTGAWNFGPHANDEKTVAWVISKANSLLNNQINVVLNNEHFMPESSILKLDCTKATSLLQWSPKWDIEMAISKTLDWMEKYRQNENMNAFTHRQIEDYLSSTGCLTNA